MNVVTLKSFDKALDRLNAKIKKTAIKRLMIFSEDPYQIRLNNHSLSGKWSGRRSINVSGDFRAIYQEVSEDEAVFVAIGTHSQLYR
ncbi:hypothetical protein COT78_00475 [Candidatus Berkelbacteria bacterium CG10_big_fil_rev_8_21_14_0_10_43_13]|uniref:Type II toxin-antitoxin system mRNA interferase toxin, RelE/StbE family n=1 Tax=Candidatus Berkelbacteria bacterium CG10_big_fil_rev_8_21_14_0_10_43_13 TaxID=1974514 RepID=A0A2H0W7E9_9BACT|nr:MAG: hypothetical protein COT78_00475 [Candidatus Berkelbacteria bacterium CG10_big_fil_rev_8_21_14_0_10_43_13]